MRKARDGFTLIELLIVVVIIGILASIAIPKFSSTREKAFLSSMKSDLRNLATLQDIYHHGAYSYTNDFAALGFVESDGVTVTVSEADGTGWAATTAHQGFPGQQCELIQGDATPVGPASVEGQIACTI